MERPRGFFTKRTEHYNNIQKEENKKKAIEQSLTINPKEAEKLTQQQQSSPSPKVENLDPNKSTAVAQTKHTPNKERPLKCLETLAQKAGITFDEKYENSLTMEKSQSPAQQVQQAQQMPMQILPEQLTQFQQFQIQQAFGTGGPTIQVKQEYATQQQQGITAADLKSLQDQHMQQMQIVQESPQSPHQNSQNIQNALQQAVQNGQVPAEYLQQRVQVLQQPIQNTSYLQQMYSPQLLMSAAGNLIGHSGLGQQQIQLIAGKPFQNQLTPQMLSTAGGKPVLTTATGAQGFSYTTLPTIPSSQSQTLLFSPVTVNGVLGSQTQNQQGGQQSILPNMQTQSTPSKNDNTQKTVGGQKVLQKVTTQNANQQQSGNVGNSAQQQANQQQQQQQCVQVSQTMPTAQILGGQTMQFTPWHLQGMTPFWTATANGIQPQIVATNPILIRGPNQDGTQMIFQQSPTPTTTHQTVQSPHNQISLVGNIAQATNQQQKVRPANENLQAKQQNQPRAPPILPQGAPIRPASSVSTQTQINQNANILAKTPKVRTKQTPVRPAAPNIKVSLNQQTQPTTMMHQVVAPGVNKMVVMSNINGQLTPVLQQNTSPQILTNDKMKQQAQQQILQQQQVLQQQIAQLQLQQQQQQLLQSQAGMQNAQLIAAAQNAAGGIQQVVLQPQQMQAVTVTSAANLQQTLPQLQQQGIMTKAGNQPPILQMSQPVTSHTVSLATSMANTHIVTSIAGSVTADTSNSILGPLSSPQTPLQPPQNPLIAMTTLSASPMSSSNHKEKVDASTGESHKPVVSTSVSHSTISSSPLKRSAPEDENKGDSKKQATESLAESRKAEESVSNNSVSSSPSVNKNQQTPSTPNSSSASKTQVVSTGSNTPLTTQNGEADIKKTTNNATTNSPLLKNELPKAMVKPNVLTHVIEGYVIQESSEPFPVTRQRYSEKENDEPPKKKQAVSEDTKVSESPKIVNGESSGVSSSTPVQAPTDMVACEHCGKQEMRSKLKRKRFCSLNCARASKTASTDSSPVISASNGDDKVIEASPSHTDKSKPDNSDNNVESQSIEEHVMMKWSVSQVCDFIKNLPGCTDYAEDFALQEIDGQALLLLKENHLVSAMGMKLGPALKIVNKIESMRVSQESEQQESEGSGDQSPQ